MESILLPRPAARIDGYPRSPTRVQNATAMGAACIQGEYNAGYGMQVQIEDGLFFNVVAPVAARLRLLLFSRTPSYCSSNSRS